MKKNEVSTTEILWGIAATFALIFIFVIGAFIAAKAEGLI